MIAKVFFTTQLLLIALFMATNASSNVLGLFPAGTGCKSAAMESAGDCHEAQTILYNPAPMTSLNDGFSGEIGIARLQYSYENPQFDPVSITLFSPIATEGYKGSFAENHGAWGFAIFPASAADLNINGLPTRAGGDTMPMTVKATRKLLHLALGGAYDFGDTGISLGATLLYTYDSRTLSGSDVTNPNTSLVDMSAKGNFFRPILGSQWNNSFANVAVSYMATVTKKFSGTTTLAVVNGPFSTELVDYDPAVLMSNVSKSFDRFTISTNYNRVFGKSGANVVRNGTDLKTTQGDLKDANHMGLRASYDFKEYGQWSLAGAYLDSFWGPGYYFKDTSGFAHQQFGHQFGQFNAIPVRNQSIVWRQDVNSWQVDAALFRTAGSTTVGQEGDHPGYYQLEFVSLTAGIRHSF